MSRNRLYALILVACLSGFIYLIYSLQFSESADFTVCLIKNVTGIPCPSCGTTRAVELIFKGYFFDALQVNPFGILVSCSMTVVPFWIVLDIITKKETFFIFYKKTETFVRIKGIAITLIILVLLNWIWNIYKEV